MIQNQTGEVTVEKTIPASEGPIKYAAELQEKIQRHTVPVFFFRDDEQSQHPFDRGSGTLVKLKDYFYILTAGHCANLNFSEIAVGIRKERHRFMLKPVARGWVHDTTQGDFGYFQIEPDKAAQMGAAMRVFLGEKSIEVVSARELRERADFMIVSGYPGKVTEQGAALVVYSTNLASTGNAPESSLDPSGPTAQNIDLWIPVDGNVDTLSENAWPTDVPDLGGASGGAIWRMGFPTDGTAWDPSTMRLVGTHCGENKTPATLPDGSAHRFARASLLGNHLTLIARDNPDLREYITTTWPAVAEYRGAIAP